MAGECCCRVLLPHLSPVVIDRVDGVDGTVVIAAHPRARGLIKTKLAAIQDGLGPSPNSAVRYSVASSRLFPRRAEGLAGADVARGRTKVLAHRSALSMRDPRETITIMEHDRQPKPSTPRLRFPFWELTVGRNGQCGLGRAGAPWGYWSSVAPNQGSRLRTHDWNVFCARLLLRRPFGIGGGAWIGDCGRNR